MYQYIKRSFPFILRFPVWSIKILIIVLYSGIYSTQVTLSAYLNMLDLADATRFSPSYSIWGRSTLSTPQLQSINVWCRCSLPNTFQWNIIEYLNLTSKTCEKIMRKSLASKHCCSTRKRSEIIISPSIIDQFEFLARSVIDVARVNEHTISRRGFWMNNIHFARWSEWTRVPEGIRFDGYIGELIN